MSIIVNEFSRKQLWYTVGPASLGKEAQLFLGGATGIRLTFSYGTPELQYERAVRIKSAAEGANRPCYVVADLAGEKYRLGMFQGEPTIAVTAGSSVRLVPAKTIDPLENGITLPIPKETFQKIILQLRKGNLVTIGDGSAILTIDSLNDQEIIAEAVGDGTIDQIRGLTIQDASFRPVSLTPKDLQDLKHVISHPIYDAVAVSFVSTKDDIMRIRSLVDESHRKISIIAKIETSAGVKNVNSICEHADIVMAARGDLALAIPWVDLPDAVQKIANSSKSNLTPWILATQIVEGLQRFAIPTRAEICDLAHWLNEGCSGVLLSYETAFGARPVDAVICTSSMLSRWK